MAIDSIRADHSAGDYRRSCPGLRLAPAQSVSYSQRATNGGAGLERQGVVWRRSLLVYPNNLREGACGTHRILSGVCRTLPLFSENRLGDYQEVSLSEQCGGTALTQQESFLLLNLPRVENHSG